MPNFEKISPNIEELHINIEDKKGKKKEITWINVNNPEKGEIEYLLHKYHFNIKHLRFSSSKVISHRPTLDEDEDYIFMILHFPEVKKGDVKVAETDFFIND